MGNHLAASKGLSQTEQTNKLTPGVTDWSDESKIKPPGLESRGASKELSARGLCQGERGEGWQQEQLQLQQELN